MRTRSDFSVSVSPGICFLLAFWMLILPIKWLFAMVAAAGFHELCHYGMVHLVRGKVISVQISGFGARMEVDGLSDGKELICALAGPAGGLILLIFARWIPRIAICAAVQALYNLLPVYPLDGGRALRCGATLMLPPDKADKFCVWAERIALCAISVLALYGTIWLDLGLFPVLMAAFLILKTKLFICQ